MVETLDPAATELPLRLTLSIVCSAAIVIYAILQPGEGTDDDDSGSGGGGLMQPVAVPAR
jgi:preprotein translocase subunit SecG